MHLSDLKDTSPSFHWMKPKRKLQRKAKQTEVQSKVTTIQASQKCRECMWKLEMNVHAAL